MKTDLHPGAVERRISVAALVDPLMSAALSGDFIFRSSLTLLLELEPFGSRRRRRRVGLSSAFKILRHLSLAAAREIGAVSGMLSSM